MVALSDTEAESNSGIIVIIVIILTPQGVPGWTRVLFKCSRFTWELLDPGKGQYFAGKSVKSNKNNTVGITPIC
jgi:hypothetical protein